MKMHRYVITLGSVLLSCSFTACDGSDDAASGGTSSQPLACSTGPAQYGEDHPPPYRGQPATELLPGCMPRCGESVIDSGPLPSINHVSYAYESMPSGACTESPRCVMRVSHTQECAGYRRACNLSFAECGCEAGQWRCYITSLGSGACSPCDADAGPTETP